MTTTILVAQNTVTWVGGTPGKETNWDEPKNWNIHKVPNEFSDVIIPDVSTSTFASPVIRKGLVELNSIQLASSTKLTISKSAQLVVYGRANGLLKENLDIKGSFMVWDEAGKKEINIKVVLMEKK